MSGGVGWWDVISVVLLMVAAMGNWSSGAVAVAVSGLVHISPGVSGRAGEEPVPDDRYHAIYFAMLLAGVGFLLPYNSFITDVDYLHHKFPGGSPSVTLCHQRLPDTLSSGHCPPQKPWRRDLALL